MNWLLWNRGRLMEGEGGEGASGGGDGGAAGGATLLGGDGGAAPAAGESAAPAAWTWAKEDGSFSEGWVDKLPENLRGHAALKVMPSVIDLAKSYVETKSMVGKKLEAPGEGATPEQLASWRKVVGAPETPEGYLGESKSLRPDAIPETLWDGNSEKAFLALAHKHNLPPGAVKEILGFYGESLTKGVQMSAEAEAAHLTAETGKLREAWGTEFDSQLGLASRVAKTAGLDPATNPIFADAEVVKAFAKLGKMFSETSLVAGDTSSSASGGVTQRITEIQDPKSTAIVAREYRGEFGPERQVQAAEALRSLLKAQAEVKGR
jgi:hypothetical protein